MGEENVECALDNDKCDVDADRIYNYVECARYYEIISPEVEYKYLMVSTNSAKNLYNNYGKKYNEYVKSGERYSEVYEIIKMGNYEVKDIGKCECKTKMEMEKQLADYLRKHRLEYINISVNRRVVKDMCADVESGLESEYIKKYEHLYKGKEGHLKYIKYTAEINKFKNKIGKNI
jgi:hypothetical protein